MDNVRLIKIKNNLELELRDILALGSILQLPVPAVTDPDQFVEPWVALLFALYSILKRMGLPDQQVYLILTTIKEDIKKYNFEYDSGLVLLDNTYFALADWDSSYNYKENRWENFKPSNAITANLISFLPLFERVVLA